MPGIDALSIQKKFIVGTRPTSSQTKSGNAIFSKTKRKYLTKEQDKLLESVSSYDTDYLYPKETYNQTEEYDEDNFDTWNIVDLLLKFHQTLKC